MQFALLSLLIVVIALLGMRAITRERHEYARFKRLRTTEARQKVYRRWLRESFVMFGGLTAVVLLAAHPFVPPALSDARAWSPIAAAVSWLDTDLGRGVALAAGLAVVALLVLPAILLRAHINEIPTIGDVGALIPRNRAEVRYGAGLALNAGVFEELLFRFAMPALIFGVIGNGLAAFLIAALVFGALHSYQGRVGVAVTTVLGLIFSAVYVLTGSIVVVIVLHVIIDVRSLVIVPLVVRRDAPPTGIGQASTSTPGGST